MVIKRQNLLQLPSGLLNLKMVESLEDDPRLGRPQTTYTVENIELVRAIIEEDPHATMI